MDSESIGLENAYLLHADGVELYTRQQITTHTQVIEDILCID